MQFQKFKLATKESVDLVPFLFVFRKTKLYFSKDFGLNWGFAVTWSYLISAKLAFDDGSYFFKYFLYQPSTVHTNAELYSEYVLTYTIYYAHFVYKSVLWNMAKYCATGSAVV